MQKLSKKQWVLFYIVSVSLLLLAAGQMMGVNDGLRVSVLDVGQGDGILIQTPEHHNILIDAGPGSEVVDRLGEQMGFFDKKIDLFVLTHPHRDHDGGILDVLQKYDVERVLLTGIDAGDPLYLAFLDEVKKRGIDVWFNQNHQDIQIGPDLYLDVLYPFEGQSMVGQNVHNKNNTSVVVRLVRGQEPLVMFSGDAEREEEREIVLSGQELRASILKLGHHGSRTSTSEVFLSAVSPQVAVISAGEDNSFGHPHPETLEKVKGLEVRQTMLEGTIEFVW